MICECRKPKPGMLVEAAKKYNIDLAESYMVGDGKNDVEAGKAAGCTSVIIGDEVCDCENRYESLLSFVDVMIDGGK